eukprot:226316_1
MTESYYYIDHDSQRDPPLSSDIIFLIVINVICIIHITYSIKFTKFSFSYLKVKCEEKISRSDWDESKLYCETLMCHQVQHKPMNTMIDDIHNDIIRSTLWDKTFFIRNLIRVLLFIICWLVFTVFITIQLNLTFEYFVICVTTSYLALIMLPFLLFLEVAVIRHLWYATMLVWSINLDEIADRISYQQHHDDDREFAETNAVVENESTAAIITKLKMTESQIERTAGFQSYLASFLSPYFMAVHWRMLIVLLCALQTVIAFPFVTVSQEDSIQDTMFLRLFVRYLFLAMTCWFVIYCLISIAVSAYVRISTLFQFDAMLNHDAEKTESVKRNNSLLRLFCLMDAFGVKETSKAWTHFKIIWYTLCVLGSLVCFCVSGVLDNGILWFVGAIGMIFYILNVLLTTKPRGIYFLWRTDLAALELQVDPRDVASNPRGHCPQRSQHVMEQLKISEFFEQISAGFGLSLREEYKAEKNEFGADDDSKDSKHVSINEMIHTELAVLPDAVNESTADNATAFETTTLALSQGVISNPSSASTADSRVQSKYIDHGSIQNFIDMFERTYIRKSEFLKTNTSTCGAIKAYFGTLRLLYKQYWLFILPHNYTIRPISIMPSGRSIFEILIKYNYKKRKWQKMCVLVLQHLWSIVKCPLITVLVFFVMTALLWCSIRLHQVQENEADYGADIVNDDDIDAMIASITGNRSGYPLCESVRWNANLSCFDLVFLTGFVYETDVDALDEELCLYFDADYVHNMKNDSAECASPWQLVHWNEEEPMFIHLRHNANKTDVIMVRGTWTGLEVLQDISLFNQVMLLQVASWVIPITTILPQQFLINIVSFTSKLEGGVEHDMRQRYDIPLFEYTLDYVDALQYEVDSLYFVGHSLGGSIGAAVAAQIFGVFHDSNYFADNEWIRNLQIKSFALSAPGMTYSSRKFNVNLRDLYSTQTTIKPRHDLIAAIDKPTGLVQSIECRWGSTFAACHQIHISIHELIRSGCNLYHSHNPSMFKAMYSDVTQYGSSIGAWNFTKWALFP